MQKITLISGPMFAGKTTKALELVRELPCIYLKPGIDNRYSQKSIVTHDGRKHPASIINNMTDCDNLFLKDKKADCILIDEVQFFDDFILKAIKEASLIYQVYLTGLNYWADGSIPPIINEIRKLDINEIKLQAVCEECGKPASYTFKRRETSSIVEVGGGELYGPKCHFHFKKARREQKVKGIFI